jgi:hypothetical protein
LDEVKKPSFNPLKLQAGWDVGFTSQRSPVQARFAHSHLGSSDKEGKEKFFSNHEFFPTPMQFEDNESAAEEKINFKIDQVPNSQVFMLFANSEYW